MHCHNPRSLKLSLLLLLLICCCLLRLNLVRISVLVNKSDTDFRDMSLGQRLKEERERLGLTVVAFAEAAGAKKNTVIDWQKDVSSPPAVKLSALADIGVDVLYVLTGVSSQPALPPELAADEQMLIDAYRSMPMAQRKAMLAEALTGNKATSGKVSVKGNRNRVAGRDNNA